MNDLILWGAGGHGKVIVDMARSTGRFRSILFIDDDLERAGSTFYGCPVLGGPEKLGERAGQPFLVTIGDNHTRASRFAQARSRGLVPVVLIHDHAVVSPSASVGAGSMVCPGAIVNSDAAVGEDCIINTASTIGHDCTVAEHVHIGPRTVLAGGVQVGPYAQVLSGAVVLPLASIGEDAIVGAGAVVLRSVAPRITVVGVPAAVLIRPQKAAGS